MVPWVRWRTRRPAMHPPADAAPADWSKGVSVNSNVVSTIKDAYAKCFTAKASPGADGFLPVLANRRMKQQKHACPPLHEPRRSKDASSSSSASQNAYHSRVPSIRPTTSRPIETLALPVSVFKESLSARHSNNPHCSMTLIDSERLICDRRCFKVNFIGSVLAL